MCRMVGMVSPNPAQGAAEAALLPSWYHLVTASHSLRQQADLGQVPLNAVSGHTDSWGIGWFDAKGEVSLVRQVGSAKDSAYFALTAEQASRGGAGSGPARVFIGHLRKASCGAVLSENAHPVRMDYRPTAAGRPGRPYESLLVAHNGTLRPPLMETLRQDLQDAERLEIARSDNDTVLLAGWLALRLEENPGGVAEGIEAGLQEVLERADRIAREQFAGDLTKVYTGLNLLIGTPEGLFVLRQFTKEPDYYTLYRRPLPETGGWVVASERTDDAEDWELIAPGKSLFLTG